MKRTYAAALLALTLCLSALLLATAAAEISAPASAIGFAVPEVIDRLNEEYGAPPQITGAEKVSDTEYLIHFDANPSGQGAKTCKAEVELNFKDEYNSTKSFSAKAFKDKGLTCVFEVDPGLDAEPTIEIAWTYTNVRIDGNRTAVYKYLYYDWEGNPQSMYIGIDPISYRFEYVNGAPMLVEYTMDDDHTGERIVAHYVPDNGLLTRYNYSFYVGDAGKKPAGIVSLTYSGDGELKGADCSPTKKRTVLYEWDIERKQWYLEAAPGKTDNERDYDVDLPDYVPDPTTIAPPIVVSMPEGYGEFEADEFFGAPNFALPMTAEEAETLGAPLPFDMAALPKALSCAEEDGGFVLRLSWDGPEAVRAALGEDGALTGEFQGYYLIDNGEGEEVGYRCSGPIDLEALSARIEVPKGRAPGGRLGSDSFTLAYDAQTPEGDFSVAYEFESETGFSDAELGEIRVTSGEYTRIYRPDGSLSGVDIQYAGSDYRTGVCTCYYDETGALSGYEYNPTQFLHAEFDLNGLLGARYTLRVTEGGSKRTVTLRWTPEEGWFTRTWDDAAEDFVHVPHEAPEGVDLSLMKPLI